MRSIGRIGSNETWKLVERAGGLVNRPPRGLDNPAGLWYAIPMSTAHRLHALLLACLSAGCLGLPEDGKNQASENRPGPEKGIEDATDGVANALARAGVTLAELPTELAEPMPGEGGRIEEGLLPMELPELGEDLEEILPETVAGGGPDAAPGGWHRSGETAIRIARGRGIPLVIWFANPVAGPLDDRLGAQVLFTPAVSRVLARQAVGLRIDFGNETTRQSDYYQAFRKKYRITGYPTLVFLQPDGTEVTRQIGFSPGTEEARAQNFAYAVDQTAKAWQNRKNDLGKTGFQTWKDRSGRAVFAKLLRREENEIILIDPYRRVFRVPLERLAHESFVDAMEAQGNLSGRKE